jgi:hypothetical protein
MITAPRFSMEDADWANDEWGSNCGPGAIAAIMGMTLDEMRPYMAAVGFEQKKYTSPAMMWDVLKAIGRPWRKVACDWPSYGLVRIQWEGPWTAEGVPIRARYRHTHWVGGARIDGKGIGVFDINCINNGSGWASLDDWKTTVVPWLLEECVPRASGGWHITHAIEVGHA